MTTCAVCEKPLTLLVEEDYDGEPPDIPVADSSDSSYIDDDVTLRCGCHFHWQCLLDTSYELTSCPNCKANISTTDTHENLQILCDLKNEGGLQESLDILPVLTEESYLKAYPEERKSRAFLEFCAQGDVPAIIDVLDDNEESDEDGDRMDSSSHASVHKDILRYQDHLGSMKSGLHMAIQNQRMDVAWLLLLLASDVNDSVFPDEVKSAASGFGITRDDQMGKIDIRALKDAEGLTAYDRARVMGGPWEDSGSGKGSFRQSQFCSPHKAGIDSMIQNLRDIADLLSLASKAATQGEPLTLQTSDQPNYSWKIPDQSLVSRLYREHGQEDELAFTKSYMCSCPGLSFTAMHIR